MKILITNDDGIMAPGIRRLAAEAGRFGDVYVAAPSEQQSAKSQSITFLHPVAVRETGMYGAVEAYEVEGTPTDCVKWAVQWYGRQGITFDYALTGINMGSNTGLAAYYSGTISAAREAALKGIRSIALSVATHEATEFEYICSLIPEVMEMSAGLSPSTVLSVNAPNLPAWEVKGVRIAEVAPYGYGETYDFEETGDGKFQMRPFPVTGTAGARTMPKWFAASSAASDDTRLGLAAEREAVLRYDYDCMHNGYASITPLVTYTSDTVALNRLKGLYPQEKTVVLFIDAQENNISGLAGREQFEVNIGKLARVVSRMGMPSVVTELYGLGKTSDVIRGTLDRSEVIVRRELGVSGSYDFVRLMNSTPSGRVMLAGAQTHTSVLCAALDLRNAGYEVTVIEDCCASRGGHDHKVAIETMRDAGCRIMTLRAAAAGMLYAVNHPAADAVRRIVEE